MKKWSKKYLAVLLCFIVCMVSIYQENGYVRAEIDQTMETQITDTQEPEETMFPSPDVTETASPSSDVTKEPEQEYKITLNKTFIEMPEGERESLSAHVEPSDGKAVLTWQSTDLTVAAVSYSGVVTAIKKGTAFIIARVGEQSVSCLIHVTGPAVKGIRINKSYITVKGTETYPLTATVQPADAEDKTVIWTSSNTTVAQVDSNGVVSGYEDGTATITAKTKDGKYSDTCMVSVTGNSITSIVLNKDVYPMNVGDKGKLTATVIPDTVRTKEVLWSTSDSSVVTVDREGNLTAIAEGTAKITVISGKGEKKATCLVKVSPIAATSIALDKTSLSVVIGTPVSLTATILPNNTTNTKINWSSSKKSVAMVNADGMVTGVSYGTATITAKIGKLSAKCKVSVKGTYGTKKYKGGGSYKGELGNGKRNGKGTLIRKNGTSISGTWSNDELLSTTATVTFKNGDIYKGCYTGYIKTGKATYTKKDGTLIKGTWKKNKLTGSATIKYRDGDKYSGNFKNNKKSGQGTYTFANGDRYKGSWKNDKMNGSGKYTFKNGAYYKGTFKNNKLTGTGYYKASKGKLYKGTFKNGKMVKVISVS